MRRVAVRALPVPRIFYGWWVVFGSAAIIFLTGGTFFYGFGAIFNPLIDKFGWSRAATSFAFSLRAEVGGIASPIVGALVDRLRPRRVLITGVILVGAGFFWLGHVRSLGEFYASVMVIAIGMSACGGTVGTVAISYWFDRRRSRALALMTTGAGTSGIMVPLITWLVSRFGLEGALTILALMVWGIAIPLALLVRGRPEDYGLSPDGEPPARGRTSAAAPSPRPEELIVLAEHGLPTNVPLEGLTARRALATRTFWLLALGVAVAWTGSNAIIVHEIPFLEEQGFPSQAAALVVTATTLISLVGRLGLGFLGDYVDKRLVLAASFVLQALGIFIFANIRAGWMVVPFLLLFAPGWGGSIPVRSALQAEYFGRKALGTIMGLTFAITSLGTIVGPVFAGWMHDTTDSYRLALMILSLVTLSGAPLVLATRRPRFD